MALKQSDLLPEVKDRVTAQDYSSRPTIEGVRFVQLKRFVDDGGSFMELGRLSAGELEGVPGFVARQVSYSTMMPGAVKAFHLHLTQNELWFVPPESRLLVGLHDVRQSSKTAGVSMRFVLGDGNPRFVYIPAGVAHGGANLTDRAVPILYVMDQQFTPDPGKTDEKRLPWDLLGEEFWRMERG